MQAKKAFFFPQKAGEEREYDHERKNARKKERSSPLLGRPEGTARAPERAQKRGTLIGEGAITPQGKKFCGRRSRRSGSTCYFHKETWRKYSAGGERNLYLITLGGKFWKVVASSWVG